MRLQAKQTDGASQAIANAGAIMGLCRLVDDGLRLVVRRNLLFEGQEFVGELLDFGGGERSGAVGHTNM